MTECVIHWFRRDLRLDDNLALEGALRTGAAVIPVFILDRRILGQPTMGERRLQFLRTALEDLDRRLVERGSGLVVLDAGDAARELNRLAEETGAWALYFNRDHTPYARWRDTRVTRGMQMTGVVTMPMDDQLLVTPHQTIGADGHLPVTFPEFSQRWLAALDVSPPDLGEPADGNLMAAADLPPGIPAWRRLLAPAAPDPSPWPGASPEAAHERLREFVDHDLPAYATRRQTPADGGGTSRLSAALKFGTISVRRVAAAVLERGARQPGSQPSVERFIEALAWREFAQHLLFDRPELLGGTLHPRPDAGLEPIPGGLDAWLSGRTGVPLVDAGLRQLHEQGWMPMHVRLVAASFLAHQLGADWRAGERHFARHLVDHDVAANDLGWQRAAGGEILDPSAEGEAHDPSGDYVRAFVPALARVPAAHVHRPWRMSAREQELAGCRVGIDYPHPIAPVVVARRR